MDNKKKGYWSNTEGFLKNEGININLASSKSNSQAVKKSISIDIETSKLNLTENFIRSKFINEEEPIQAPFLGTKVLKDVDIDLNKLIFYLDTKALFSGQWQIKKGKNQSVDEYNNYLDSYAKPLLDKWLDTIIEKKLISPKAVYGYFRCGRKDNSIFLFDDKSLNKISQFNFPRQKSGNNLCIADFYCDLKNDKPIDIFPMQAVTMGDIASEYSQKLFKEDKYSDYLLFHGLTVQLAEALAEYVHALIRIECGFRSEEPDKNREILAQKYRGARYSFGYPACPKVSDSNIQLSLLDKWLEIIIEKKLISPKAVYGYFRCGRKDNSIFLFDEKSLNKISQFNFPRQKSGNNLCIADFYCDLKNDKPIDIFPMQAVTMGDIASEYSQKLFKEDKYSDYLLFHGLTVQLAEALAEYVHALIRVECGFSTEEPDKNREILAQKYRGAGYSFGYPACPKVSDSNIQLSLLDAKRINLTMDESEQLHPEQSTTAIISLHSKAKYFSA